jgi:transposase
MTKRKWRTFTEDFKKDTVRLIREGGKTIAEIARDLDLAESAVRNWHKQAEIEEGRGAPGTLTKVEREELWRLRRENKQLQMERDIPKESGLLRQGQSMRSRFIGVEKAHGPITVLCRVLRVSTSGFYAWLSRRPSARANAAGKRYEAVTTVFTESRGTSLRQSACARRDRRPGVRREPDTRGAGDADPRPAGAPAEEVLGDDRFGP